MNSAGRYGALSGIAAAMTAAISLTFPTAAFAQQNIAAVYTVEEFSAALSNPDLTCIQVRILNGQAITISDELASRAKLEIFGLTHVIVTGGRVKLYGGATVDRMTGGTVIAKGMSSVNNISGGSVSARDFSTVSNVSGGEIKVKDRAKVEYVTGGQIDARGYSTVSHISGGIVHARYRTTISDVTGGQGTIYGDDVTIQGYDGVIEEV